MTKSRLLYGALLVGLCVFHIMLVDHLSYFILVFFLLLPCISLLLTLFLGRGSTVRLRVPAGEVLRGEGVALQLHAKNPALLPFRTRAELLIRNELLGSEERETLVLTAGRQGGDLTQTLSSARCGKLQIRVTKVGVYDLLGLFCFTARKNGQQVQSVFALPASVPLAGIRTDMRPAQDTENDGRMQVVKGDDPSELYDLRDYQAGDRVTRIHWKLSDKLDRLVVKEFGRVVASDVLLLLDLNGSGAEVDALLTCLRSLSSSLLQHGMGHEVEWYDGANAWVRKDGITGEDDLRTLLVSILSDGCLQDAPFAMRGKAEGRRRRRHAKTICLCAGRGMAEQDLRALCSAVAGAELQVIAVSEDAPPDAAAFLPPTGVTFCRFRPEEAEARLREMAL
ncbi:MAG: DUF58 domain-containing protein [Clostridiales Family XIII bacterium]|jgi:uncharacterized protein (DUF58 family)|nr:DUF58 domain-containing protein [Clostridiales Family XIII bacterium]